MSPVQVMMFIYLSILSTWDVKRRELPSFLLVCGGIAVVLYRITVSVICGPSSEQLKAWVVALLGALPGLLLTVLSCYTDKIGRGDGLVLMIVGACENCTLAAILICMACIFLTVVSFILMLFRKVTRNTRMPFIPFVALAYGFMKIYEGSYIRL